MRVLKYKLLEGGVVPFRKHATDAGHDLCAASAATLRPHSTVKIPTGVCLEIPEGCFGLVRERSSVALKGVRVSGIIDADYRGEVHMIATNTTSETIRVENGERIAQVIITPVTPVWLVQEDELSDTERGDGGFGSTNKVQANGC